MSEHFKEPKWGFWIPVKDKQSATYAAKMSGLPVFLLGLSFLAQAFMLFLLTKASTPKFLILILGVTIGGMFFIYSGLLIRKHKFATLPISVGLWLGLTAISIFIAPSAMMVISLIIGLLCVSGLRGWWWLKQNPER